MQGCQQVRCTSYFISGRFEEVKYINCFLKSLKKLECLKVTNQHSQPILLLVCFWVKQDIHDKNAGWDVIHWELYGLWKNWRSIPEFAVKCEGLSPFLKIHRHPLVETVPGSVQVYNIHCFESGKKANCALRLCLKHYQTPSKHWERHRKR